MTGVLPCLISPAKADLRRAGGRWVIRCSMPIWGLLRHARARTRCWRRGST